MESANLSRILDELKESPIFATESNGDGRIVQKTRKKPKKNEIDGKKAKKLQTQFNAKSQKPTCNRSIIQPQNHTLFAITQTENELDRISETYQ